MNVEKFILLHSGLSPRSLARDVSSFPPVLHAKMPSIISQTEDLYYLPQGSWILVTGANGFVGSNVVHHLLELGFRVRGTVREAKPWLDEMFQERFGEDSYESVLLPNFENVDTLCEVMDGVSGVAHVVCCSERKSKTWLTFTGN